MESEQPMCSICLKRKDESRNKVLLDIMRREASSKSSLDKIQELMKVEIVLGYKTICSTCKKQVDEAYALREKILQAITYWRNHLALASKIETDPLFEYTKEVKHERDDPYSSIEGDSQESKVEYTPPLDKIKTENEDSLEISKEIPGMVDLTEDKFEVISLKDNEPPPKNQTLGRISKKEESISLKSLRCGKCKYYFSSATEVINHICENSVEEQTTINQIKRQNKGKKRLTNKRSVKYGCARCGKLFPSKKELRKHRKPEHRCTICNRVFKVRHMLKEHYSTHTGERKYSCNICNKTFHRASSKSRHMRKHTSGPGSSETPFLCSICGKIFPYSNTLSRHMQAHAGVKRFQCKICQKMFNQTAHLRVHMRTHTGEKPYTCQYCSRSFSLNATLRKHIFCKHKDGFETKPNQTDIKEENEDVDYEYQLI